MNVKYELERNYNVLKYEISDIQYELLKLEEEYSPKITAKYGGIGGGVTNTVSDKVFTAVSDKEEKTNKLLVQLERKQSKLELLDNLIATQNTKAQRIVRGHAIDSKFFSEISKELKDTNGIDLYSTEYCKKIYYKSLKNMQKIVNENNNNNNNNKGE